VVGAVVTIAFGVWCDHVVAEAARVQGDLEYRHDLVRDLQWAAQTLHTHDPSEPVVLEALDRIRSVTERAAADPELKPRALAAGAAAERLRAALEVRGGGTEARVEVMQTSDGLMREIWRGAEALDADLDDRWLSIEALSLFAIGGAALAWLLFAVALRRGLDTEDAYARSEELRAEAVLAREAAMRASDAKSEFLATVSHEIRTPMMVMLGRVELLRTTTLEVAQTGHLDIIDRAGDQLLQLISDVLDLSRIEAGALELHPTEFDLDRLLDEAVMLFLSPAQTRGLQLRREGDRFGTVLGDEGRIRQVMVNLIGNALKFTVDGGITVCGRREAEEIVLEVLDTGPGLPPGMEESLFGSFTQADSSSSRRHGGAGLGLAISRRLVEAMGGTISARNRPDVGAQFTVRIPLPSIAEAAISEELDIDLAPSEEELGPRVLVVDDNDDTREVVKLLLEALGCRTETAAGGAEAIDRAHTIGFDMIFMDCDMPGIDGLTTTSAIRSGDGPCARVAIVGLSGYATPDAKDRALESGMDEYLAKPIRIGGLKAAVERWTGDEGSFPQDSL